VELGSVANWGPLSAESLRAVLSMAAEVADADADHDLLSALDVLNKDRLAPADRLYEGELRQVARALLAVIPVEQLGGLGDGEVAAVNAFVMEHVRARRRGGLTGGMLVGVALPQLFRSAADHLENPHSRPTTDGGDGHA
jgi:hypothetical protein